MLASCDSTTIANEDLSDSYIPETVIDNGSVKADSYIAPSGNRCVDSWIIDAIKGDIYENAQNVISGNKRGFDDINQSLLHSADLTFGYISEPIHQVNGGVLCSAQIDVTYAGNEKTKPDVLASFLRTIEQGAYAGPMMGTGINTYNLDRFSNVQNNGFSVNTTYEVGTTYSESGAAQESYIADIDAAYSMLALAVLIDRADQEKI